ncbi:hypothetical protein PMAYCL1PPCAC_23190, partial [Pristionchus mayeri]
SDKVISDRRADDRDGSVKNDTQKVRDHTEGEDVAVRDVVDCMMERLDSERADLRMTEKKIKVETLDEKEEEHVPGLKRVLASSSDQITAKTPDEPSQKLMKTEDIEESNDCETATNVPGPSPDTLHPFVGEREWSDRKPDNETRKRPLMQSVGATRFPELETKKRVLMIVAEDPRKMSEKRIKVEHNDDIDSEEDILVPGLRSSRSADGKVVASDGSTGSPPKLPLKRMLKLVPTRLQTEILSSPFLNHIGVKLTAIFWIKWMSWLLMPVTNIFVFTSLFLMSSESRSWK